ncbi:MAG: hypothetical protein CMJ18_24845 [Phycisphaeraceae bacterium]|nr:hypothetical protein [Phycisphaeraceae bacterium]
MTALNVIIDTPLRRTCQLTRRLRANTVRWAPRQIAAGLDFLARAAFHVWRQRRYLTTIKLCNMALINIQYRFKSTYVLGRPYRMKIEPTNICNTSCQLCPTGIGMVGRPRGVMSFDDYARLIDRLRHHLVSLDLSMWGDPLICPDIYRMIRYARDRRIWTYISSNLHAYKPGQDQGRRIVESGLELLTCSLHGATQETFEAYQPGKRLDQSLEKIRDIIATRDRMGSATPEIQLNFVVTRRNEHEIEAFRALARELGCKAIFSNASMNARFVGRDRKLTDLHLAPDLQRSRRRELLEQWLPKNREYVLEPYRQMARDDYDPSRWNGSKLYNCDWPWRASVINWDGKVVTCCGSFDPKDDFGNVLEKPFGRIWNSRRYRMARRSFKSRLAPNDAESSPCASCPGFMV